MFNFKKTKCMVFPPRCNNVRFSAEIPKLQLSGVTIEFCDNYKHLGHILKSDRSDVADIRREMRLLFVRTNSLIGLFNKFNVDVKKLLWQSFNNDFYGAYVWSLGKTSLYLFKRAYNNCLKRFFGYCKFCKNRDVYYKLFLPAFDTLMSNARFRHCSRRLKLCENNALLSSLFCIYPFNVNCKL